jgi:hypothetical protein
LAFIYIRGGSFQVKSESRGSGKDQSNCAVIVHRHYFEVMSEISTAKEEEEAEPTGQCVPRRNLGKSNRAERGKMRVIIYKIIL